MSDVLTDLSPPALVAAIEANTISYYRNYRGFAPTQIHDDPDLLWLSTGLPVAEFNGVLRADLHDLPPAAADARIAAVLTQFSQRNLPLLWHIGPSTRPAELGQRLLAHGLRHEEDEPGMAADLLALDETVPSPPALCIQPVRDSADLHEWLHVWAYDAPDSFIELCSRLYGSLGIGPEQPLQHYLGVLDGRPVATAALFYGAGVVSVQHVVTLPDMRRRGIGAAMTLHVARVARAAGYRVAVLTASPAGLGTYRRLGFRSYCLFSRYRRDAA